MRDSPSRGFRIGDRQVEPGRGRIITRSGETHVEPRAMDVLVALAGRPGDTISRDELILAVWKHPHVSDAALSRCISMLRQALGDDRSQPQLIETVPKRGYRLVAPVDSSAEVNDTGRRVLPGVVTPDWSKTNLVLQLTRIIGREAELAKIGALIAAHRLVTLTGSGGVGKTRLAIEAGGQSLSDFADGVWLVELAALSDPSIIPLAVATALGIELGLSTAPMQELTRRIGDRDLLLIVDNCEHLTDAAGNLAQTLLGTAGRLRILATSRAPLAVHGEQLYRVPSLAVPGPSSTTLDEIAAVPAVQLFVERARAADSRFVVDDGNVAHIAAICRRLDGIPLAIEMAAVRAPLLGVAPMMTMLDDRFRVLTEGRRTALPRQQTLRATLDWSHSLLSDDERTLLRRLSAFAGGFTLDAVTAVASGDSALDVAGLLARLIAHSLVVADSNADGMRYHLLETTRAYAMERLNVAADRVDVQARHLAFYLELAEDVEPKLRSAEQGRLVARLDRERENFLAAFAFGDRSETAARLGLRLASALQGYWIHRGGIELGLRLTVGALARPGAQLRDMTRCRALNAACHLASCMNRPEETEKYSEEFTSIALETGDELQLVSVLFGMAGESLAAGNLAEAHRYLYEALRITRRPSARSLLRNTLQAAVDIDRLEGDLAAAERHALEGLALGRELEQPVDIGVALLNLAAVSIDQHRIEGVGERLVEALRICADIGSKPLGANALMVCAGLSASLGEWKRAARWHAAARHQNEQTGWACEPADEAFITRVIERTRKALSAAEFSAADSAGRAVSYEQALDDARRWLELLAATPPDCTAAARA